MQSVAQYIILIRNHRFDFVHKCPLSHLRFYDPDITDYHSPTSNDKQLGNDLIYELQKENICLYCLNEKVTKTVNFPINTN